MKRLRSQLTYANVVSTLCLVLLVGGGTAFAATQLGKNSVGPKQLRKDAVTPAKLSAASKAKLTGAPGPRGPQGVEGHLGPKGDPGESATALWAAIGPMGEVLKGSGVTSARNLFAGGYEVTFDRDVTACSYQATQSKENGGFIIAEPRTEAANALFVETTGRTGTLINRGFDLAVFC